MSVLKLFGVYTHNKLEHGGLWDAVGQHLQRRGSDHRKRCKDGDFFVQHSTHHPPLGVWLVRRLALATITVSHSHSLPYLRYMKKQLLLRT